MKIGVIILISTLLLLAACASSESFPPIPSAPGSTATPVGQVNQAVEIAQDRLTYIGQAFNVIKQNENIVSAAISEKINPRVVNFPLSEEQVTFSINLKGHHFALGQAYYIQPDPTGEYDWTYFPVINLNGPGKLNFKYKDGSDGYWIQGDASATVSFTHDRVFNGENHVLAYTCDCLLPCSTDTDCSAGTCNADGACSSVIDPEATCKQTKNLNHLSCNGGKFLALEFEINEEQGSEEGSNPETPSDGGIQLCTPGESKCVRQREISTCLEDSTWEFPPRSCGFEMKCENNECVEDTAEESRSLSTIVSLPSPIFKDTFFREGLDPTDQAFFQTPKQVSETTPRYERNTFSVAAWFQSSAPTTNQRIVSITETGGYQISLNENSVCGQNNLCFLIHNGDYVAATIPSSAVRINQWHHVVGVYDGQNVKLYLDGQEKSSTPAEGNVLYTSQTPFCIGGESSLSSCIPPYLSGFIDEVFVYDKALTAEQVSALYASYS